VEYRARGSATPPAAGTRGRQQQKSDHDDPGMLTGREVGRARPRVRKQVVTRMQGRLIHPGSDGIAARPTVGRLALGPPVRMPVS
jgi:hypothetical protein